CASESEPSAALISVARRSTSVSEMLRMPARVTSTSPRPCCSEDCTDTWALRPERTPWATANTAESSIRSATRYPVCSCLELTSTRVARLRRLARAVRAPLLVFTEVISDRSVGAVLAARQQWRKTGAEQAFFKPEI